MKMGLIRIIKTPRGEAPESIREAWVGLELPCHPTLGFCDGHGLLSGKPLEKRQYAFRVPQTEALEILHGSNPVAATWWRAHGFPQEDQCFGFAEDEAEIIRGVRRQSIIHVEDDMQGDPYR